MYVNFVETVYKEAKKHHLVELYKDYADFDSRLKTYPSTPAHSDVPDKHLLTEAGFIWRGTSVSNDSIDQTECFWCGLKLENWQKEDNPWVEHAK